MTFDGYDKSVPVKKLDKMEKLLAEVSKHKRKKILKMRINKLIGALGNLDQIAEGIKNKFLKEMMLKL